MSPLNESPRVARERKTIRSMLRLYCRAKHGAAAGLCDACASLDAYAMRRLDGCPFGLGKPICSKCPIHCYKPEMRERIREVMRFAGPRMLLRHPILTIRHMIDSRRDPPERGPKEK